MVGSEMRRMQEVVGGSPLYLHGILHVIIMKSNVLCRNAI